ncbi:hypothetical protein QNA27_08905 [Pantoea eucalypti]|uniref:hypothetical protein n=1 Tax=Pantoea eucalypti TaxID=470933 RepID=UPI0024BA2298|nr:hypothetical protein [Pantoea eucalypti]MDJ0473768.1 hypothetical protein [Pantoea eucalypti]
MSIDLAGTWRVKDNRTVENLHGHWIADTGGKNHSQLIAAAPELLEALQDALHAHDKHGEHSEWDFARAAIAKALGQ